MKLRRRNQNGFTLIELLVVFGIIALLAATLSPPPGRPGPRTKADSIVCKSHLRQMGLALILYVDDHANKFPNYSGPSNPAFDSALGPDNTGYWWAKLLPYYPVKWTDPTYHCPGYKGVIAGSSKNERGLVRPFGSYAYNARGVISTWGTNAVAKDPEALGLGGKQYPTIAAPVDTLAIGESRWKNQGEKGAVGGHDFMEGGMIYVNKGALAFDPARHGKFYNQLFCDGHVGSLSPWVLFNFTNSASMWNYDGKPHPEFWPGF